MRIKMGMAVCDTVTQFTGFVTARAQYITGCEQVLVQPTLKDREFREARWFDEPRLQPVEPTQIVNIEQTDEEAYSGGPKDAPPTK